MPQNTHNNEEVTGLFPIEKTQPLLELEDDDVTVKSRQIPSLTARTSLGKGALQAFPIVIGYIPLAFAYGVMAAEAGLSLFATVLMSVIVFAGSAQYIAIGLFASYQPILSIVITTFIVNLRHLLLSTSILPHLAKWKTWQRLLFACELTDEAFAIHSTHFGKHQAHALQNISTNMTAHASWILGSLLGFLAGSLLPDIRVFGLDFALAAMFIALLLMQIKNRLMILIALFSGLVSVTIILWDFKTWSVIIASLLGATLGLLCELWQTKESS